MELSGPTSGIDSAISKVNSSAQQISKLNEEDSKVDLVKEEVKQIEGSENLKANVRVAQTQDEMMGTAIDMLA